MTSLGNYRRRDKQGREVATKGCVVRVTYRHWENLSQHVGRQGLNPRATIFPSPHCRSVSKFNCKDDCHSVKMKWMQFVKHFWRNRKQYILWNVFNKTKQQFQDRFRCQKSFFLKLRLLRPRQTQQTTNASITKTTRSSWLLICVWNPFRHHQQTHFLSLSLSQIRMRSF